MISIKGTAKVVTLARTDPVFARVRAEAEDAVRNEPDIAGFIFSAILNQDSLEAAIVHRLGARLAHQAFPGDLIEQAYFDAIPDLHVEAQRSVQLLYKLKPPRRGRFEFGTLTLERASLILVKNAEGRWNLERWLPPATGNWHLTIPESGR